MAKHRRKYPICTNCDFVFEKELPDNFCPRCGQENHDLNVPFNHVALEFLEGTIHYDSKFWTTVKYLLFYPGKLTNEFHRGRRVGYVPPIRLYVFISFVFFFMLSLRVSSTEDGDKTIGAQMNSAAQVENSLSAANAYQLPDSVRSGHFKDSVEYTNPGNTQTIESSSYLLQALAKKASQAELDSTLTALGVETHNWFTRGALQKLANLQKLTKAEVLLKALKYLSIMMFVLMPVFALLLKLVFLRAHRYYMEHLIFSIHLHCFFFLLFIIYMLLLYATSSASLFGWFNLLGIAYLYLGLKRVFKRSHFRTFLNMLAVLFLYATTGVLTLLLGLVVSIAL